MVTSSIAVSHISVSWLYVLRYMMMMMMTSLNIFSKSRLIYIEFLSGPVDILRRLFEICWAVEKKFGPGAKSLQCLQV